MNQQQYERSAINLLRALLERHVSTEGLISVRASDGRDESMPALRGRRVLVVEMSSNAGVEAVIFSRTQLEFSKIYDIPVIVTGPAFDMPEESPLETVTLDDLEGVRVLDGVRQHYDLGTGTWRYCDSTCDR